MAAGIALAAGIPIVTKIATLLKGAGAGAGLAKAAPWIVGGNVASGVLGARQAQQERDERRRQFDAEFGLRNRQLANEEAASRRRRAVVDPLTRQIMAAMMGQNPTGMTVPGWRPPSAPPPAGGV